MEIGSVMGVGTGIMRSDASVTDANNRDFWWTVKLPPIPNGSLVLAIGFAPVSLSFFSLRLLMIIFVFRFIRIAV